MSSSLADIYLAVSEKFGAAPTMALTSAVIATTVSSVAMLLNGHLTRRASRKVALEVSSTENEYRKASEDRNHQFALAAISANADSSMQQRAKQFEEMDYADAEKLLDQAQAIIFRIAEATCLERLSQSHAPLIPKDHPAYFNLKRYCVGDLDRSNPDKSHSQRFSFLLMQLLATHFLVSQARYSRPLSSDHQEFLRFFESNFVPIIRSGRYPGYPIAQQEMYEMIVSQSLRKDSVIDMARPINWIEYVDSYRDDEAFRATADKLAGYYSTMFNEDIHKLEIRTGAQTRLAILCAVLLKATDMYGRQPAAFFNYRDGLSRRIYSQYAFEKSKLQEGATPPWSVFRNSDPENIRDILTNPSSAPR